MEDSARERIGILGGSFNPIHIGHLILAQCAIEAFDLSRVLLMPCTIQPLKSALSLAPVEHRAAMVECAIEDNLAFEMCDIEIQRDGPSYTIDSIRELTRRHPNADLFFIIGADTLPELHGWKEVLTLLGLCTFVTLARPGFDVRQCSDAALSLPPPWPETLLANVATGRLIDISSSDIRHRVAEGMSIRYLVPRSVEMYISEHGLYRCTRG